MAARASVGVLCAIGMLWGVASCGAGSRQQTVAASSGRARQAWVGWRPDAPGPPAVRACGSNAPEPVPGVGQAGCWRGSVGGPLLMSDNGFVRDTSPADRVPSGGCMVTYEDAMPGGGSPTARAWLGQPSEGRLAGEWQPQPQTGDRRYSIEVSFSPDGKWMAIVHLRTSELPGGTEVDVDGVEVVPARRCP